MKFGKRRDVSSPQSDQEEAQDQPRAVSRRRVIGTLAATTAAAYAGTLVRPGSAKACGGHMAQLPEMTSGTTNPAAEAALPPPWQLLQPLTAGARIRGSWRLADLSEIRSGSCVMTLQSNRGRSQRVHVCRKDTAPHGLLQTKRLDLIVMNGGQGGLPTDEGFAQALARLADILARNENTPAAEPIVTALLPHSERLRLYGNGDDGRLR